VLVERNGVVDRISADEILMLALLGLSWGCSTASNDAADGDGTTGGGTTAAATAADMGATSDDAGAPEPDLPPPGPPGGDSCPELSCLPCGQASTRSTQDWTSSSSGFTKAILRIGPDRP
jgi:hypothetical protein